ncbi:site-specific DNA-methyltransferase [Sphingomonas sp.]|uniref:DNA-methyltransferase n=1 Tax=Sphingomonas sp. TaxID=28214 RepID=UPI0035A9520C
MSGRAETVGRVTLHHGDCRDVLAALPDNSTNCCVTSPPYFGLRDYGVDGQMGLEPTPDEFVAGMVAVFREVRRVLRDDGTLWLNIGDSYNNSDKWGGGGANTGKHTRAPDGSIESWKSVRCKWSGAPGIKPKDLIGIPWMLAFALRADGWYLRQDIIWSKPNPMPESVTDRCTKAHEYLFLLSKSARYYYDAAAIAEPLGLASVARLAQNVEAQVGSDRIPGKTNGTMKAVGRRAAGNKTHKGQAAYEGGQEEHRTKAGLVSFAERERAKVEQGDLDGTRNRRSVWTVATQPFKEAHFATFPPALIEPCIFAGCPVGGTVLDPFGGAGTTGLVADRLQRNAVLIELNPEYVEIARRRIEADRGGLLGGMEAA